MIKNYFRLLPTCTFINGKNDGCLYDTLTGKMIQLDIEKTNSLKKCENNISLLEIKEDTSFLSELIEMRIGDYYEYPIYVEPININYVVEKDKIMPQNYYLNKMYLEISTQCNLNCFFCNRDNILFRKTGCKLWIKDQDEDLNIEQYEEAIKSFKNLRGEEILFIGAEPLLKIDLMRKIIYLAQKNGINKFTVYTNGTLITNDMIDFFSKNNITINLEIFSLNVNTYKIITSHQYEVDNILTIIKDMVNKNINVISNVLINKYNDNEIENIVEALKQYIPRNRIKIEFIYNKPENNYYSTKFINDIYNRDRYFGITNNLKINYLKLYNSCLYGKIAITITGDVLLCPMMRTIKLGNIKNKNLNEILKNSKYDEYTKINADSISQCSECSFKYNCTDCRAIEMSATNDLLGLEYCNYK